MTYADVNGIRLNYERKGDGDTVVLITGFGGDVNFWNSTVPYLSDGFDVITVDNRGAGKTAAGSGFELSDMADDIIGLMDALSVDSAHILGWSMGSHVAIDMAAGYSERVKTLTVMSSYRFRPARSRYVLSSLLEAEKRGMPPEYIGRLVNGFCLTEDFFRERENCGSAVKVPAFGNTDGLRLQLDAIDRSDVSETARRISVPTLSVHGLCDIMVEPSEGDSLASAIEDCGILRIEGAGHVISPRRYVGRFAEHMRAHSG